MRTPEEYAAALRLCCFVKDGERVSNVLRHFSFNGCESLAGFIHDTQPEMTVSELWAICQHYKSEFNPERYAA